MSLFIEKTSENLLAVNDNRVNAVLPRLSGNKFIFVSSDYRCFLSTQFYHHRRFERTT